MHSYKYGMCRFEKPNKRRMMMWTTPAATEMRFGFEVTMYVMNK